MARNGRSLFGIGTQTPTRLGIRVRTPKRLLKSRNRLDNVRTLACSEGSAQINPNQVNRVELNDFVLPVLSLTCVEVTDVEGARTIVWEHEDGTVYHQDCSTPHPKGSGYSFVYQVV